MKRHIAVIAVVLLAAGLASAATQLKWYTSFDEAKKAARKERKSLVVVYYLEKDEKTKLPLEIIETNEYIVEKHKEIICCKVEDSAKPRFNVYPVVQYYYPSGNEFLIKRLTGTFRASLVKSNLLDVIYASTDISNAKLDAFVTGAQKTYPAGTKIRIRYKVLERGLCVIRVFDGSGKLIKKIEQSVKKPDSYFAEWDQKDSAGAVVKPGKYLISFELASYKDTVEFSIL